MTKLAGPASSTAYKPKLKELLQTLGLDVAFVRGEGAHLTYLGTTGREVQVLDLVGGYGSLLFGHNHPKLVAEAHRILEAGIPFHAQGSVRPAAEALATELSRRAGGDFRVVFANSGAEAVEAAMKHAMLETGSRRFIALERAFHGKTLGALQLAGCERHRPDPLRIPGIEVCRVLPNDIASLEAAFAGSGDLAGFVFEPVIGEGGVLPLDIDFVRRSAGLCHDRDVPLIADECQTGLGRTGHVFASQALGVEPDYLVLSKALGGGLAKISALLIRAERFQEDFDFVHTSTYADDDFSCAIALKVLEMIDDEMLRGCRERGAAIRGGLDKLAEKFPDAVAGIRGAGLMMAVEFRPQTFSDSFVFRYVSGMEDLGYLITGYLFHVHRIRVAPTLSERNTLRIAPPANLDNREIAKLLHALEDVCQLISAGDAVTLTKFLTGPTRGNPTYLRSDVKDCAYRPVPRPVGSPDSPVKHVGWLCHLIDADGFCHLEPAFEDVSFPGRERMLDRWISRANPVLMNSVDVRSDTGDKVRLHVVMLPFTSAWVKRRIDSGDLGIARKLVHRGVEAARTAGATMVSLGQYTSIITANGTRAGACGCGITTGNAYAVALAVEALRRALRIRRQRAGRSTLVVAGAGGNIGRTCAEIFAPEFGRTVLLGSQKRGARRRLEHLATGLSNAIATDDPFALAEGDVVIMALNASDPPFGASHFKPGAVICDLSVPSGVQEGVAAMCPDLLFLKGGVARLPGGEDLGIPGFPLPVGQTYGCMAEGILLGLEGVEGNAFTGLLTPKKVIEVTNMARKHGFDLADYKTECVLGGSRKERLHAS